MTPLTRTLSLFLALPFVFTANARADDPDPLPPPSSLRTGQRLQITCPRIPKLSDFNPKKAQSDDSGRRLAELATASRSTLQKIVANQGYVRVVEALEPQKKTIQRYVPMAKQAWGYPILPPNCYADSSSPKKTPECTLGFNPKLYQCSSTKQTLFWRQAAITEYYPSEDHLNPVLDESHGRHTDAPLTSVDVQVKQKREKQSMIQRGVSMLNWLRGDRGLKASSLAGDFDLGMRQSFIPALDLKFQGDTVPKGQNEMKGFAPINFRFEDTGADRNFTNKGDPILDYPIQKNGTWKGPRRTDANAKIGSEAALRVDVRTLRPGSIKSNPGVPWWVGICVSNEKLANAQASRRGLK